MAEALPGDFRPLAREQILVNLIAGRYESLRLLGRGASSSVHLVRDTFQAGARFALKKLPRALASRAIHEFRQLRALQHPCIPRAWDTGVDVRDDTLYFTSDYIHGTPFLAALQGRPLETQLEAVAEVLRVLDLVHSRCVVHRDLKPDNIVVNCAGSTPRVALLDFGLASFLRAEGEVSGSLPYLAPELFEAGSPAPITDLYALGMMLYELWCGRHPLDADTPLQWVRAHQGQEVTLPDDLSVPMALGRLILRLLAKDPEARYPHAASVLTDLARISLVHLPAVTRRSLHGRIRSVPAHAGTVVPGSALDQGPEPRTCWIQADTRCSREALLTECKAQVVAQGMIPVHVRMESTAPMEELGTQVAALTGEEAWEGPPVVRLPALAEALAEAPVALLIEELDHRIPDQETWLKVLLRQDLTFVISSSRSPGDDSLGRELERCGRTVEVIQPARLGREQLEELLPHWLGVECPVSLLDFLDVPGGIETPALVEQMTVLLEQGALEPSGDGLRFQAPSAGSARDSDLKSIYRQRLALLTNRDRRVLELLAISGVPLGLAELERLTDLAEERESTLRRLAEQGWVRQGSGEGGALFAIAGGVLCEAVLAETPTERQRAHHAALAVVLTELQARSPTDPVLARHAWRGAPSRDTAAAVIRAAETLLRDLRFLEAQTLLEELSDAVDHLGDRAGQVLLLQGTGWRRTGSLDQALQALRAAHESAAGKPWDAEIRLELARVLERLGQAEEALALLPSELAAQRSDALAQRAFLLYRLGRLEDAEEACRQASARLPDEPTLERVRVHNTMGLVLQRRDRLAAAREQFERAIALSTLAGNPVWKASAQHNLGHLEDSCGNLAKALELFQEGRQLTRQFGERQLAVALSITLAYSLLALGRVTEARSELQRAREDAERLGMGTHHRRSLVTAQAVAALQEGELEAAQDAARQSRKLAEEQEDPRGLFLADVLLAEACLYEDHAPEAARAIQDLLDRAEQLDQDELRVYARQLELVQAAWIADDQAREQALDRAQPSVGSLRLRSLLVEARVRALLVDGRREQAVGMAEEFLMELRTSDLVDRVALLESLLHAARGGGSEQALAGSRVGALVQPGHRRVRAECLYWLGSTDQDAALLQEAEDLARSTRHGPLLARIQAARRGQMATDVGPSGELARRRLHSLERLKEVAKLISSEMHGEQLLRLVLDQAVEMTAARRGFLILLKGGSISIPAARNMAATDIQNPEFSVSSSVARSVAEEGRTYRASNVTTDERFRESSSISHLHLQSVLCVPLKGRADQVGAIYLDDPTQVDHFDDHHQRLVEDLSDYAAIALEKAQLLRQNQDRQKEQEKSRREIARLNQRLSQELAAREEELDQVKESLRATRAELVLKYEYPAIITVSPVMRTVLQLIDRITDSVHPVHLYGESGTGKELIARSLHVNGPRSEAPYFSLNCASLSPGLIESELFGHVKGAFTGATRDKPGILELADTGTLFLDEVGDAAPDLQARLLRAIQFGEVLRVGSDEVRTVDVRLISASNRNLQKMVEQGSFREDLLYRLNVHRVVLPPLRDRVGDLTALIEHFMDKHSRKLGVGTLRFQKGALSRITNYPWPGNVRELENCIIDLLVRVGDESLVTEDHLPEKIRGGLIAHDSMPAGPGGLKQQVEDYERALIRKVLEQCGGVRAKAARELRMSERNLYKKLSKYGLASSSAED